MRQAGGGFVLEKEGKGERGRGKGKAARWRANAFIDLWHEALREGSVSPTFAVQGVQNQ